LRFFSIFGLVCHQLAIPAQYKRLPMYSHDSPTNQCKKKRISGLQRSKTLPLRVGHALCMQGSTFPNFPVQIGKFESSRISSKTNRLTKKLAGIVPWGMLVPARA
jgi:hypothetical protein